MSDTAIAAVAAAQGSRASLVAKILVWAALLTVAWLSFLSTSFAIT